MELGQKAVHRMGLFWKLGSGPLACPQVRLIPCDTFQERHFQEGVFISVINHDSFTVHSVQPEILLNAQPGSLPPYITGLKQYEFCPGSVASLVKLQ